MKRCWVILTGEYPPQPGGVSDYTRLVALGLTNAGDDVHIWSPACPANGRAEIKELHPGVVVHRLPDHFGPAGLAMLSRELRALPRPWRLLVQYVPHAFGYKAMNLPFCLWLWLNRRHEVSTMFHEVAFPWVATPLKHNLLAAVHRLMALIVARASKRIFVSTTAWNALLSPLIAPGRCITWSPVPSNLPTEINVDEVSALRRALAGSDRQIVGYFGSYSGPILSRIAAILPQLISADKHRVVVMLGRGGDTFIRNFTNADPNGMGRLIAPGEVEPCVAAQYLSACDLLVLPYPDGASSRRSSLMAGLALGVPILTTDGSSTEPLWRDSDAVALIPAGDSSGLTSMLEDLLADPARRKALGERGARLYRQNFSIDRTIDKLLAPGRICPEFQVERRL